MGPSGVAILCGAGLATRSNDTEFRFRQDSDFHYLTGFDHPNAVAVFRTDGGPAFTLFVEPRDPEMETWNGYRPGTDGALADFGANEAYANTELHSRLPDLLKRPDRLFHVLGRDRELDARIVENLETMRRSSRAGAIPPEEIVDPRRALHEMRLHKTPEELEILRRGAAITHEAHHEAAKLSHGGVQEYEVEAVLDYTFRRRGSSGPAYGSIVGGGANATVLHYVQNNQPLRDGELLLIDAGCELEGYASDVTRTYPIGGSFNAGQRAVYEIVLEAQLASIAACQLGATLPEVHNASLRTLTQGMIDLGLLDVGFDEAIEKEAYRRYYMHGTSHWIGLDVHDAGTYTEDGQPRHLEAGMLFSVEPGLYITADDENAKPELRGIGIRIEDDVVITDDGYENLTESIPKEPAAIEAWVREGLPEK
jgi:Xaa-Pro aminopeptidase